MDGFVRQEGGKGGGDGRSRGGEGRSHSGSFRVMRDEGRSHFGSFRVMGGGAGALEARMGALNP